MLEELFPWYYMWCDVAGKNIRLLYLRAPLKKSMTDNEIKVGWWNITSYHGLLDDKYMIHTFLPWIIGW